MNEQVNVLMAPGQLDELLDQESGVLLIDVRDADEYAGGHIRGAEHVPLQAVAPLFDDPDNTRAMVFVCESGLRSLQAANFALIAGLRQVWSLEGGMAAWRQAYRPRAPNTWVT